MYYHNFQRLEKLKVLLKLVRMVGARVLNPYGEIKCISNSISYFMDFVKCEPLLNHVHIPNYSGPGSGGSTTHSVGSMVIASTSRNTRCDYLPAFNAAWGSLNAQACT